MTKRVTAPERIIGVMERNGIDFADVVQRVAIEEDITLGDALDLVNKLERGVGCPVVVAAAVISIIADRRVSSQERGK